MCDQNFSNIYDQPYVILLWGPFLHLSLVSVKYYKKTLYNSFEPGEVKASDN